MTAPKNIFVTRMALIEQEVHAKCIFCSPTQAHVWDLERLSAYVLPDGPAVEVRQVADYDVLPGYPVGGERVYEDEPFFKSLPAHARQNALVMQNYTYVLLPTHCLEIKLPFFLGVSSLSVPAVVEVEAKVLIEGIGELPDVRAYVEGNEAYLRSGKADKWDAMMFNAPNATNNVEVPARCYLPGTIRAGGRDSDVVYEILEYLGNDRARIRLYIADNSILPSTGSIIERQARLPSGKTLTQRIAEIS